MALVTTIGQMRVSGRLLAVSLSSLAATVLIAGATDAGAWGGEEAAARPQGFHSSVERLSPKLRQRMDGNSWHEGCPVGLGRLRLLRVSHWDFRGRVQSGRLVVHERYAGGMADVFARLFAKRFPIRRMELIDRYGADDHRSMAHDNTSAFNCRFVNGTNDWSTHAYGKAVDINPRENPYVSGEFVSPPEGRPFADRSDRREGMILGNGPVVGAFERLIGWKWGGRWSGPVDYQHMSASGT